MLVSREAIPYSLTVPFLPVFNPNATDIRRP